MFENKCGISKDFHRVVVLFLFFFILIWSKNNNCECVIYFYLKWNKKKKRGKTRELTPNTINLCMQMGVLCVVRGDMLLFPISKTYVPHHTVIEMNMNEIECTMDFDEKLFWNENVLSFGPFLFRFPWKLNL